MRLLFFYLFYHILTIIYLYILKKYFENISQNISQNIQKLRNNPEIKYFMNIVSFIKRISPVDKIIDEICFTCNISTKNQRIIEIKEEIRKSMEQLKKFNSLTQRERANELRRNIIDFQEITSSNSSAGFTQGMAMTGTSPVEVVQVTSGILYGIFSIFG